MRIAYVNYGSQSGVTDNVTRALLSEGHTVEHLDCTGPLDLRFRSVRLPKPSPRVLFSIAAGVAQYGAQAMNHRWNTPYAFDVHSARAGQLLRRLRTPPDVVLQNGALFSPGLPPRLPYVLLCDNTCRLAERQPPLPEAGLGEHVRFGPRWNARETRLYQGAAGIAVFSRRVRDSLISDYGVDGRRVQVVGAGCNVFPEQVERVHDGNTLLFIGKGDFRRKGGGVLLSAFARLRQRRPAARLLLAGPTESLDLHEGAENLGLVPFHALPGLFARATAFVLPTLREPFGIAFLDAMACGVPCIGTQVGAVPDLLDDGRLGMLVPPADDVALADAMEAMLSDPAGAQVLGERGRLKVIERGLRWHEVGRRVEALLEQAARGPEQPRRARAAAEWRPAPA